MRVILKEVAMSNFLNYPKKEEVVNFPQGMTGILGDNGAGKTSILNAVTFTLFGFDSKHLRNKLLQGEGVVRVTFQSDSEVVQFEKRATRGGTIKRRYKVGNGGWTEVGGRDYDAAVSRYVGLDYKAFTRASFVEQDMLQEFSGATPAIRLNILKELFEFKLFDKAYKACLEKKAVFSKDLEILQEAKRFYEQRLMEIETLYESNTLAALEKQELLIGKMLSTYRARKEEVEKRMIELSKSVDEAKTLNGSIAKTRSEINRLQEVISSIKSSGATVEKLKGELLALSAELVASEKEFGSDEDIEKRMHSIEEKKSAIIKLQAEQDSANRNKKMESQRHRREKEKWEATIKRTTREIEKVEATGVIDFSTGKKTAIKYGVNKGIVLRIKAELENDKIPREVRNSAKKMLDSRERFIKKQGEIVERFVPESSSLQFKKDSLANAVSELDTIEKQYSTRLETMSAELKKIEQKFAEIGTTREQIERNLASLREIMKKRKNSRLDQVAKTRVLSKIQVEREREKTILQQVETLQKQLSTEMEKRAKLDPFLSESKTLGEELGTLFPAIEAGIKNLELTKSKIKIMKMNDIEEIKKNIKERNEKITEIEVNSLIYDDLKNIFKKDLATYILSNILPQISDFASGHVSVLSDSRITGVNIFRLEKGVEILVNSEGETRSVDTLSGGEKVVVSLALRFAMCQVLSTMTDVQVATIFLDEIDLGSLDQSSANSALQRFIERLEHISQFFYNVIIISHLPVADYFNHRYLIYRDSAGKSRVIAGA